VGKIKQQAPMKMPFGSSSIEASSSRKKLTQNQRQQSFISIFDAAFFTKRKPKNYHEYE
jgi:hypothetical protein